MVFELVFDLNSRVSTYPSVTVAENIPITNALHFELVAIG